MLYIGTKLYIYHIPTFQSAILLNLVVTECCSTNMCVPFGIEGQGFDRGKDPTDACYNGTNIAKTFMIRFASIGSSAGGSLPEQDQQHDRGWRVPLRLLGLQGQAMHDT